jgi:hypothetical protein
MHKILKCSYAIVIFKNYQSNMVLKMMKELCAPPVVLPDLKKALILMVSIVYKHCFS